MKHFLFAVCFVVAAASTALAQTLSPAELKRASEYLEKTSAAFIASTKGLSEAQLTFKTGPTRWSVAEVSEHIASAEDFIMGMVHEQVMKAPERTEPTNVKEIDDFVLQAIPDRSHKLQAPEPLVPANRFGTIKGSVDHFKESRAKTLAFLNETPDLREHAIDSPLGKKLDAYQWILFVSAHTERHTKQIEEVKADPNFPKS
ncbi:MAG: DinB family protein [Opitutus sp.]